MTITRNRDHSIEEREEYLFYQGELFSGVLIERYPDGTLNSRTEYVHGRRQGYAREYVSSGFLRYIWHFTDGKKDGLQEGWYLEGPKRFEKNFRFGILEGVQTEWHLNGSIYNQQTFHNGVEIARKVLYPTQEIFSNYVVKGERKYGIDSGPLCLETKKEGER